MTDGRNRRAAETKKLRTARAVFDGGRLSLARLSRGLTKKQLAEKVGVTPAAIGQYERELSQPSAPVIAKLRWALRFPPEFFEGGRRRFAVRHDEAHFRSLRSTSKLERSQVLARAELLTELVAELEKYVKIPKVAIPDIPVPGDSRAEIEGVAAEVRKHWGMSAGPIPKMVRLLESKGCVVTRLTSESAKVDAFSTWMDKRPLIILSDDKDDVARSRLDAAHELGHLIMHHDAEPGSRAVEQQAFAFAMAFLMPRQSALQELPRGLDWRRYAELKRRWGISMKALVRYSRELGLLSEASYKRAMVQYSKNGWQNGEPGELEDTEQPILVFSALEVLRTHRSLNYEDLARDLRIEPEDLNKLASDPLEMKLEVPL
jgi:Zn-dependent peptidase ImmA (M78 family)/transcriptional regulator with XRE-family HTH domain